MSGICGVIRLDRSPSPQDELGTMLNALARRGPDARAAWTEGPAALGIALLAATPEAMVERLPLHHAPSGCTITGDIRIDNRGELVAALGFDAAGQVVGDGEIVLHAYLTWGTDCLARLLGDFAFAIWDAPRHRLLCARDQMGMRPFLYHHAPGTLFSFASETDALLAHPAIPSRINDARIADFLEDMEALDLTSTFYRDLYRLPPAHALIIEGDGLRTWRYWQPEPPVTLQLKDNAAYAEAFLSVFTESVRDRLRAPPGKLGSMLSGGMDSGSVTAVAARLLRKAGAPLLPSFSATSAAPDCVETRTIRAAQTLPHIAPNDVALEGFGEYADELLRLTQASGEPFDGHMAMLRAVYLAAHKAGITVMLDGAGGDTTLMADDMVAWRLRRGDIAGAWREASGARRFWGAEMPSLNTFVNGARYLVVPEWLRTLRSRAGAGARHRAKDEASLVALALAQRVNLAERRAANARHIGLSLDGRCDDRRALVTHPFVAVARERYDRVAAPLGVEPRDPFLDRRVVEFCLTLPADQIEFDGWPKIVLRRAMVNVLPDAVRWRVGKEHVGGQFEDAVIARFHAGSGGALSKGLQTYVRPDRLTLAESPHQGDLAVATRITMSYLQLWLFR